MELPKITEEDAKSLGLTSVNEINKIIASLEGKRKTAISYIQREFAYSYPKAKRIYEYLINKYIKEDGTVIREAICLYLRKEYVPGIKIIFLDVDGVLNSAYTRDTCGRYIGIEDKKVSLLKEIVDKSGAKIILVSTWKEYWYKDGFKQEQDYMANYLDEKLAKQGLKIVDKTDDYNSFDRGDGILEYISELQEVGIEVDKFVILDDEMFDYKKTKLTSNLIQTSYLEGLKEKHVRRAIEKLC